MQFIVTIEYGKVIRPILRTTDKSLLKSTLLRIKKNGMLNKGKLCVEQFSLLNEEVACAA